MRTRASFIPQPSILSILSIIAILLAALCFGLIAYAETAPAKPAAEALTPEPDTPRVWRNVVLIGWDGAQREHMKQMLGRRELPNLAALAKDGALVDIDVTTGATDTKAGWTQILTGMRPEATGVYSNNRFQPIPAGLTVFERVEKAIGPDKVYTAMIVAKSGHVDNGAPARVPYARWLRRSSRGPLKNIQPAQRLRRQGAKVETQNGRRFVVHPGKPYYLAQKGMDSFRNGLSENRRVGELALQAIEKNKDGRFLLFVHFARPDHDGHAHGENSPEYSAGIKDGDTWTGTIVKKLKELDLYDDTGVYVVVDHGFDEGKKSHRNAPNVFLGTNDSAVVRSGDRADIAPTVLHRLGLDLAELKPALHGKPLTEKL